MLDEWDDLANRIAAIRGRARIVPSKPSDIEIKSMWTDYLDKWDTKELADWRKCAEWAVF
jgi:hypothetical protein